MLFNKLLLSIKMPSKLLFKLFKLEFSLLIEKNKKFILNTVKIKIFIQPVFNFLTFAFTI